MAWYWWIIIIIGVIIIGYIKLKVLSKMMAKRKQKEQEIPED